MAALLIDVEPGDEIIMPSYTFVSTANAFALRGAKIVFADSNKLNPNNCPEHISKLITPATKAIVVVHYAGIACDMDAIMELAKRHNLYVIEDAAQCIDSYYKGKALGSIGHLAAFSFHETKNIISGEGGMLVINDDKFIARAEILWEKGTNRSAFYRGEVDKYSWVDIGSSFLPSEVTAAFLWAQLEAMDSIQARRKEKWDLYYELLKFQQREGHIELTSLPDYATNNAHIFYIMCRNQDEQEELLNHFKRKEIQAIFHYLPLHKSPYYLKQHADATLPNAERYGTCLIRLPLYVELTNEQCAQVAGAINEFFGFS
jgi:dTDP-4-amino-4,6-dideoxygalactose transaminase